MEELTIQTIKQPPRIVMDYLCELKIRCDYAERGCQEFVPLELLKTHITDCGFSPVRCSNEGCDVVINKRDRRHHETQVCASRTEKCRDWGKIRNEVDGIKRNLAELKNHLQHGLNKLQDEMRSEMDQVTKNFAEIKNRFDQMCSVQEKMMSERDDFLAEMKDEVKRLTVGFHGLCPFTTEEVIIISGGCKDCSRKPLNSAEMFSWFKKRWAPLNLMQMRRNEASSIVYGNQVIIAGGWTTEGACSTMETFNTEQLSRGQWVDFPAKMPHKSFAHRTVVFENRMILIGGWNHVDKKAFDSIYEVLLVPPYSSKQLSRMLQPRCLHSAELIGSKLFIFGGTITDNTGDSIDSVVVYDINNNKLKQLKALPFALCAMATVVWKDKVILLGGTDKNDQVLNTVLMYDTTTEDTHILPHMKYCRDGCSAVVNGNEIVVMGGVDEEKQVLNVVERFSFDRYSWMEMPTMIEPRTSASAVVTSVKRI